MAADKLALTMQRGQKPKNSFSNLFFVCAAGLLTLYLSACEFQRESDSPIEQNPNTIAKAPAQILTPSQSDLLIEINARTDRLHDTAIADSKRLNKAIDQFLENGSDLHLEEAKRSWLAAHASLTTLMAVYQAEKPRENLFGSSVPYSVHSLLDATPMLPGYLDAVPGYPASGIISSLELPINIKTLVAKHQYADRAFVVFGLHPLEFFLWKKGDLLKQSQPISVSVAEQPKNLPATKEPSGTVSAEVRKQRILNPRRKAFLRLVSQEYENQLVALKQRWHKNELATAYLQQPERSNQVNQTGLSAIMLYIDSFIADQLMPAPDGIGYLFEQHYQYSGAATSFWKPVILGIEALLEISNTSIESLPDLSTDLHDCLSKIASTSEELQSKLCQNEVFALKEKIILSFAQAVSK